ncbi:MULTISPECIES: GNAT family N-acetyltransferase [unclassified Spirosoma]|uniref:GNAT family N-acetyltransferase n=1 Tax=unclassified Spirosoma TaxID=2621999 RepID=UPI000A5849F0|nr:MULTISPECIES: GNAT family N-acetyltransferase [unclassified Spirosoma]MBN8821157.1 GNAT family N-acetyltransferase [Spirosoma sp.]
MITITQATEHDLPTIQDIAHRTWPNTFGEILSPDQISYMLDMMYSLEALKSQVNDKQHVFLLAKEDTTQEFLGYSSYELNYKGQPLTKIHKIYLLPASQGKGVGRLLIDAVAEVAKANNNDRLGLNVNRYNKAIQFYERVGFSIVGNEDIDIGDGFLMEDFVMEKPL